MKTQKRQVTITDLYNLVAHETVSLLEAVDDDAIPLALEMREGLTMLAAAAGSGEGVETHLEWIDQEIENLKQTAGTTQCVTHLIPTSQLVRTVAIDAQIDMTLEFFLLEHLETFHKRYPGVRISVTNVSTPETLRLLHDGAIDFGAVSSPVDGQAGLVVRSVSEIQDVFVAGARFDELRGRTLSPLQLAGLPIVCLEQNTSTRRYIDAFLSEHGVRLQPEFELATSPLIAQFAARGMGVGSLVRNFALPFLRDGRLFELTLSPSPPPRNICLVYDGRLPLSTAASRLLEQML